MRGRETRNLPKRPAKENTKNALKTIRGGKKTKIALRELLTSLLLTRIQSSLRGKTPPKMSEQFKITSRRNGKRTKQKQPAKYPEITEQLGKAGKRKFRYPSFASRKSLRVAIRAVNTYLGKDSEVCEQLR